MIMQMFAKLDIISAFNIPEKTLYRSIKLLVFGHFLTFDRFLITLVYRYRVVPFHNFFHAFNVTQTLYVFLTTCGAGKVPSLVR